MAVLSTEQSYIPRPTSDDMLSPLHVYCDLYILTAMSRRRVVVDIKGNDSLIHLLTAITPSNNHQGPSEIRLLVSHELNNTKLV